MFLELVESYSSLFTHAGFESQKASDIYRYWFVDHPFFIIYPKGHSKWDY